MFWFIVDTTTKYIFKARKRSITVTTRRTWTRMSKVRRDPGSDPTNSKRYPGVEVLDRSPRLAAKVEATGSKGGRGGLQSIREARPEKKQRSQADVVNND